MKSSDLLIEYRCPRCGAPAVFAEIDRLYFCLYCRAKSYLMHDPVFRYLLPDAAPPGKDLLFFPYWRFKGMLFSCLASGVEHRFLDLSFQAVSNPLFPVSLGLRSQALKLRFVTPENKGKFLQPEIPFDEFMKTALKRSRGAPHGTVFHRSRIGEAISLIYAPFYCEERLYDAVLNRPISGNLSSGFEPAAASERPEAGIRFIPALCPGCGWDLEGGRAAEVLTCSNCRTAWQPGKNGFRRVRLAWIPGEGEKIRFFPFWRIRGEVEGIPPASYADLARRANLQIPTHFWTPAFKAPPRIFLRLSTQATFSQPAATPEKVLPPGRLHPVTLPPGEAAEMLKTILADLIVPRDLILPRLHEIEIKPESFVLTYLPFHESHHEFIQKTYHLTIHKGLLAHLGNL